ncbi:MAG: type III secretion protein [Phycisphaerales bacterium]|nr:MAG: type III secretion protein [Phycisphaerales bacterium]
MPVYDQLLDHVPVFFATLARLAGLFIFAPVLGSPAIPARVKVLLVLALTAAVYPTLNLHDMVPLRLSLIELAPVMATEALIGLSIGLIAAMPLISVQMGGLLMGQQMGLGLANIYNPAIDSEADIAGQLLFYMAMGVFLTLGGLDILHASIVMSFDRVPIGGFGATETPLLVLTGLIATGFELAVRVAAPVLCIIFLETVAMGFIMKTVPQINILSFGFPIRIMMGIGALLFSLHVIQEATGVDVEDSLMLAMEWIASLAGTGETPPPLEGVGGGG